MAKCLKRYWFEFDFSNDGFIQYGYLPYCGCGVTAYDFDDVLNIMRDILLQGNDLPKFSRIIENIDVSSIEDKNVTPNLGVPVWRGIWYPAFNLWQGAYIKR